MAQISHASHDTAQTISLNLPNSAATNGRRVRIHAILGSFTNVGTGATYIYLQHTPLGGSARLIAREPATAGTVKAINFIPLEPFYLPEPQAGATARQYAIALVTSGTSPANGLLSVIWSLG